MLRALVLSVLLLPWGAQGAVTATDVAEIRAVIHRQIGSCPRFHPTRVQFLGLTVMGADAVQRVHLTDGSGTLWMAYYAMQRQPDGRWRTNGCHLVQPARTIPT